MRAKKIGIAAFINAKIAPNRSPVGDIFDFGVGNIEIFGKIDNAESFDVFDGRDGIEEKIRVGTAVDVGRRIGVKRRRVGNFIDVFDFSKVTNLSFGRKIARIIQEFDVIAVQGVRSQNRAVLE
ncbi:MAG: hypothetical protein IKK39_10125, partial [Thermoguttaceae bacterium]|nr:hypothetical protein [Thermoguttaceae bacterium]